MRELPFSPSFIPDVMSLENKPSSISTYAYVDYKWILDLATPTGVERDQAKFHGMLFVDIFLVLKPRPVQMARRMLRGLGWCELRTLGQACSVVRVFGRGVMKCGLGAWGCLERYALDRGRFYPRDQYQTSSHQGENVMAVLIPAE